MSRRDAKPAALLILDENLTIIAANRAFCASFAMDANDAIGSKYFELAGGAWEAPALRCLLEGATDAGQPVQIIRFDLPQGECAPRRLLAEVQQLIYAEPNHTHLMLCLTDVADPSPDAAHGANLHESMALLVREVRHRVTNSLQIVASILLMNARRAPADDARGHLQAAYGRVMAVAALERQLAEQVGDEVGLQDYFARLCASITDSVISEPDRISLRAFVDPVVVSSGTAASLGMIASELIINALKHAFPGERKGTITVSYDANGSHWVLSIGDNGVGIADSSPTPGLGAEIVLALARQLHATVDVADGAPGTITSISYSALGGLGITV